VSEEILAFLRKRLDEDEQAARECGGAPWVAPIHGQVHVDSEAIANDYFTLGKLGYVATVLHEWDRQHIVRHDPARVLRRIEADRRLIDQHVGYYGAGDDGPWPVQTLRHLAAAYDWHPDFKEAWRV
jgi:hypothetical protein